MSNTHKLTKLTKSSIILEYVETFENFTNDSLERSKVYPLKKA